MIDNEASSGTGGGDRFTWRHGSKPAAAEADMTTIFAVSAPSSPPDADEAEKSGMWQLLEAVHSPPVTPKRGRRKLFGALFGMVGALAVLVGIGLKCWPDGAVTNALVHSTAVS